MSDKGFDDLFDSASFRVRNILHRTRGAKKWPMSAGAMQRAHVKLDVQGVPKASEDIHALRVRTWQHAPAPHQSAPRAARARPVRQSRTSAGAVQARRARALTQASARAGQVWRAQRSAWDDTAAA